MIYDLPQNFLVCVGTVDEQNRLNNYLEFVSSLICVPIEPAGFDYRNRPRGYRYVYFNGHKKGYGWFNDSKVGYERSRERGEYQFIPQEWWMLSVEELISKFNSILGIGADISVEISELL